MQVKQKHLQFTCVLSVFDRRDLFLNYDQVIHSIFKNTILPNFLYLIVDGPISYNFRKKINLSKKKFKIKVFWLKNNIGDVKLDLKECLNSAVHVIIDPSRAKDLLGWNPKISLSEGIQIIKKTL
jgi:hypothetical protein